MTEEYIWRFRLHNSNNNPVNISLHKQKKILIIQLGINGGVNGGVRSGNLLTNKNEQFPLRSGRAKMDDA